METSESIKEQIKFKSSKPTRIPQKMLPKFNFIDPPDDNQSTSTPKPESPKPIPVHTSLRTPVIEHPVNPSKESHHQMKPKQLMNLTNLKRVERFYIGNIEIRCTEDQIEEYCRNRGIIPTYIKVIPNRRNHNVVGAQVNIKPIDKHKILSEGFLPKYTYIRKWY